MPLTESRYEEQRPSSHRATKTRWVELGKVAVTTAIIALLVSRVDIARSASAMRESLGYWLVWACLVNPFALIVSAFKWGHLLRSVGICMPRWTVVELYTIGFFSSSFLPGVIGGDVVRYHLAGKERGRRVDIAATIVAERITGVVVLVMICLLAVVRDAERLATPPVLTLLGTVSSLLVAGLTIALHRRLATRLMYRTRRQRMQRIVRPLYQLHRALRSFPRKPLLVALGYSFIFYLLCGLTFFCICRAFGVQVTWLDATAERAIVSLLILIPISVGGLGLTEAGDIYLLGILGIDAAHALGISVVRKLINYIYALFGGILFIRWQYRPGPSAISAHHSKDMPAMSRLYPAKSTGSTSPAGIPKQ